MAPKLKDIAKLVGVTPQLVSFYLNHPDTTRVKKETRDKIDEAVKKLKYRSNIMGRALVTGRTSTIALIMGGFSERKRGCYAHALMNEAKQRGYHLLIAITNYNHQEEREALEHMVSRQVDGIIYTLDLEDDSEIAQRIQALKLPVLLHSESPHTKFDTAGNDYSEALDDLGRFLKEQKSKHLYYQSSQETKTRRCIEQVAQNYSLDLTIFNSRPFDDREFIEQVLRDRPDAILEFNAAKMANIIKQISAIAPDYQPNCFCGYGLPFEFIDHPMLVAYIQRQEDGARQEIEQLISRIENPEKEIRHISLTTQFMAAEDIRALRDEQLKLPEYQPFQ